jgi:hypothetical protein
VTGRSVTGAEQAALARSFAELLSSEAASAQLWPRCSRLLARIYAEQIQRWRTQGPSAAQTRELDRLEEQNRHLRAVTTDVLALAQELRTGTIDRIMAMSDLEVGLQASSKSSRRERCSSTLSATDAPSHRAPWQALECLIGV